METEKHNQEEIIDFASFIEKIHHLAEAGKKTFFYAQQLQKLRNYALNKRRIFLGFYELPAASKFLKERALLYKYIPRLQARYSTEDDAYLIGCLITLSVLILFAGFTSLIKLKTLFWSGILFGIVFLFWAIVWMVNNLIARQKLIKIETFTNKFNFELEHLKYYGDGNLQIPLDDLDPDAIKITPPSGSDENNKDA